MIKRVKKIATTSPHSIGVSLVFFSSLLYGFRATLTKIVYSYNITPSFLIFICSVTASLSLLSYFYFKKTSLKISLKMLFSCISLGMMFSALCYSFMNSLDYIPVSLATFIFFSFPVLIAMQVHIDLWILPSYKRILSFILAIFGLTMIFVQAHSFGNDYAIGVLLAGIGAIMKAGTTIMNRTIIKKSGQNGLIVTFYKLLVSSIIFGIILYFDKNFVVISSPMSFLVLTLNVILFVAAVLCYYSAVTFIGPVRVSFLSYFQLLVSIGSAVIFLGETLTIHQLIGAMLLILSLFLMPKRCR